MSADQPRDQAGGDLSRIPDELKALDRWVAFKLTRPRKPGDKFGKVPVDPKTGSNASSTDPGTWSSFERALLRMRADRLAGVGFVFNGDGIVGVDLDKCRDPETGAISPEAQAIVTELQSYTEVSPSGTGLHIFVRAKLPPGGRRRGWIEIYEQARFFTTTGSRVEGTPVGVEKRQAEIEALHARVFAKAPPSGAMASGGSGTDEEILERARSGKAGKKFSALWSGKNLTFASDSEGDLALCNLLARWAGGDPAVVDRLFRQSSRMRPKWDEFHGERTYGQITVAKAVAPKQGRQARVDVHPGRLPEAVREAHDLLAHLDPPEFFQRDKRLFRLVRLPDALETDGVQRPVETLSFQDVGEDFLLMRFAELADWCRQRGAELVRVDPPASVATALLASVGRWKLPHLIGFVEAPTLRADGSVLDTPGYDPKSRLYLDFDASEFGAIPREPTRADALAALEVLKAPFVKFPFVSESDRSAHLAAVVTALVRRSLPSAPLFAYDAPTMATGKSLLASSVSIIATGRSCASMSQGHDPTEDAKRIFSVLRQGDLIACIDNVERVLDGGDLCIVTSERTYEGRLLGASQNLKLPCRTLWLATGNNLTVRGDLVTRTVLCGLDAGVERPETRKFEGDLRAELAAERPKLVRAALTVLRAFVVAGSPRQGILPFGRFEEWSLRVREPLVWLGMADPLISVERLRDQDPVTVHLRALLWGWQQAFGAKFVSVHTAIGFARNQPSTSLAEALLELASIGRDGVDARAVGVFLRQHRGRPLDGRCFERGGEAHGVAKWRVSPAGEGGMGGSNPLSSETKEIEAEVSRAHDAHTRACERAGGIHPYPPSAPRDAECDDPEGAEGAP